MQNQPLLIDIISKRKRLLEFLPDINQYKLTLLLGKEPVCLICRACGKSIDFDGVYFCKEENTFYHGNCLVKYHKPRISRETEIFNTDHTDYLVEVYLNMKDGEISYEEYITKLKELGKK